MYLKPWFQASLSTFLLFDLFEFPLEVPIQLCLKHFGISLVLISSLLQFAPINQFKKTKPSPGLNTAVTKVLRFQFQSELLCIAVTKIPDRKGFKEEIYFGSWF